VGALIDGCLAMAGDLLGAGGIYLPSNGHQDRVDSGAGALHCRADRTAAALTEVLDGQHLCIWSAFCFVAAARLAMPGAHAPDVADPARTPRLTLASRTRKLVKGAQQAACDGQYLSRICVVRAHKDRQGVLRPGDGSQIDGGAKTLFATRVG